MLLELCLRGLTIASSFPSIWLASRSCWVRSPTVCSSSALCRVSSIVRCRSITACCSAAVRCCRARAKTTVSNKNATLAAERTPPVGEGVGARHRRLHGEILAHLGDDGVPPCAAKLAEVAANGGTIDASRFEVPGVVVLGLFRDPAGNPMALVEMQDGKPKIP